MDRQRQADKTSAPSAVAVDDPPAPATRATPVSSLLSEIARAMQAAAERERKRIDAGLGGEETVQVEKVHARAAMEAAALHKAADDDVELVNGWCEEEIRRIREEAGRRIADRRSRLEQSVSQHGSLIEAEVQSVHLALQDYRGSLGAFFGRLADEKDPSAIARLAGTLPEPPDLDKARADARSRAMTALDTETAAKPPSGSDDAPPSHGGGVSIDELIPVMGPDAGEEAESPAAAPPTTGAGEAPSAMQHVDTRFSRTWRLGRSAR